MRVVDYYILKKDDAYFCGIEDDRLIWTDDIEMPIRYPDPHYLESLRKAAVPDGEIVKYRTEIEVIPEDMWRNGNRAYQILKAREEIYTQVITMAGKLCDDLYESRESEKYISDTERLCAGDAMSALGRACNAAMRGMAEINSKLEEGIG